MVVITLEKCPLALRGDLTKWLQEISPGVYVGNVSARVRDKLWERVCAEAKNGRATMVFSARNEQHLVFRVHNALWEPIDFDGMKLMLRPSATRLRNKAMQDSNAPRFTRSVRRKRSTKVAGEPEAYAVVDIETTGLSVDTDAILEIAAIICERGEETASFSSLIKISSPIPTAITLLTGITQKDVLGGRELEEVLLEFVDLVGTYPLVMHNAEFDMSFIDAALEDCDMDELDNQCIDTLLLARKRLPQMASHKLEDLCAYYGIETKESHRALADCRSTREVFRNLLEDEIM